MNLYKITVLHGAPKDSRTSIETYLAANNEQEVFDWIDGKRYGAWTEMDDDNKPKSRVTDDGKVVTFKEWVMQNRGDLTDDEGWEDAYYGVTKHGWEQINASPDEIETLLKLGVAQKY